MEQIQLFDNTFTLTKITAYSLSLEIDYNHIAYTIVDHIRHRFVALYYKKFEHPLNDKNFLNTIEQHIKNDQYLQKHYKEVNFIYPSNKFLLIPQEFFSKQDLKLYFQTGNELLEGEEIQFNFIPEVNTYLVFAISSEVTNFFVYRFPEINFYHQGIPLIRKYAKFSQKTAVPLVGINIRKKSLMDILVMSEGKLLFYNIFKCLGEDNAIYTILRVLKDFGYNAKVELMGDISTDDKIYKVLDKYLPNLTFAKLQDKYTVEFNEPIDIHSFVNLFYIPE